MNNWTYLPDMIEKRFDHAAVSMGNKMFVISGEHYFSCEVFDSTSRKFTYIKKMLACASFERNVVRAVIIGHKIIVFPNLDSTYDEVHIYDTVIDQWCVRKLYIDDVKPVISCSKLPIV